ncbi:threonine--tRNA ligase [Patescibacteria group bacterium]|nr:threonine--tRNA ligase [Patescibacteria group bacterium]
MDNEKLTIMRHSLSHILAQAVLKFYPNAKLTIGPAIDNGFYYDFDLGEESFAPGDLKRLEKEMKNIVKAKYRFEQYKLPISEALEKVKGNEYKHEMIDDLAREGETEISFYKNIDKDGNVVFEDMCRGPHVESTGEIGAFKLQKLAGAYWRGDEKNKMLQRIYGLAFETNEELENYLNLLEEAEKRDHRVIGKDLFVLDPVVGLGLPLWKPKGAMLWRVIEDFWYKAHLENGYELVRGPHIGSRALWETSGHWNFYNESMYPSIEVSKSLKEQQTSAGSDKPKEEYLLKPMNCPFHVEIYKSEMHSYKDLPLRWAECGTVYRYEKSGELSGLTRVRGFTQDDAHIICTREQVAEELKRVANFIKYIFDSFGFSDYKIYLSLRDPANKEKYTGNDEGWEFTEAVMEKVASELGIEYSKEIGEAAFYGPKLDYKVKDALGREWQCSTLQFDFNLPERFDMTYINSEGKEERPYMLHRALMGSFERFIGLLIEHYAGAFPLWLSPVQVKVLPISEKFNQYAEEITRELKKNEIRVVLDNDDESLGKKIRNGEKEKVPYLLVVGEKEETDKTVAVRRHGKGDLGAIPFTEFIEKVVRENKERVNE